MRLTMQDKNEFLKAAVKATDLDSLKRWVVGLVDAADTADTGSGKADTSVPCPPYVAPAGNGHMRPTGPLAERRWEDARLT